MPLTKPALSLGTAGEATREPHGLPAVKTIPRSYRTRRCTGEMISGPPLSGQPGKAVGHAVGKLTLRHDLGDGRRQPLRDQVPHPVGQDLLGYPRDLRHRAVRGEHERRVVAGTEGEPVAHLVDNEKVAPLPGQFLAPGREHIAGFLAESDDHLAGPLVRPALAPASA